MEPKQELDMAAIESYWMRFIEYGNLAKDSRSEMEMSAITAFGPSQLPTLGNKLNVALQMHIFDTPASELKEHCSLVDELFLSLSEEERKDLEIHASPLSEDHALHIANGLVAAWNKRMTVKA